MIYCDNVFNIEVAENLVKRMKMPVVWTWTGHKLHYHLGRMYVVVVEYVGISVHTYI